MNSLKRVFSINLYKPVLLTPGPLSCSSKIKQKMMKDYGSRDKKFTDIIRNIRSNLLDISKINKDLYTTVLIPGSGTYAIESTITSSISKNDKLAIFSNGAYGIRMTNIADISNINYIHIKGNNNEQITAKNVTDVLKQNIDITHIAIVHHETTTGILNPIDDVANEVQKYNKTNQKS